MPTYLLTNRAPLDYRGSPEAMTAWNEWFDHLGAHLVDRGNPVFARTVVGSHAADTNLGGYTLITADSLEAATALAASSPMVRWGGGVEIGELTPINPPNNRP
jgi:hypothetical protein